MNDVCTRIIQQLQSLSLKPEVHLRTSIKSVAEHTGVNYEAADNALIELENDRYINTFRTSHDVEREFIIHLTDKGFAFSPEDTEPVFLNLRGA